MKMYRKLESLARNFSQLYLLCCHGLATGLSAKNHHSPMVWLLQSWKVSWWRSIDLDGSLSPPCRWRVSSPVAILGVNCFSPPSSSTIATRSPSLPSLEGSLGIQPPWDKSRCSSLPPSTQQPAPNTCPFCAREQPRSLPLPVLRAQRGAEISPWWTTPLCQGREM